MHIAVEITKITSYDHHCYYYYYYYYYYNYYHYYYYHYYYYIGSVNINSTAAVNLLLLQLLTESNMTAAA